MAAVGLINAVERFDPDRGVAFSSFAVPTILGELKRHFRDTGWIVRVDRRTQERAVASSAAQRELGADGLEPTVATLADRMDCLSDTVGGADPQLESAPERADIRSAVRHLPRLERRILYLRFSADLSQREIAKQVGISQMHVSRLLRRSRGSCARSWSTTAGTIRCGRRLS